LDVKYFKLTRKRLTETWKKLERCRSGSCWQTSNQVSFRFRKWTRGRRINLSLFIMPHGSKTETKWTK